MGFDKTGHFITLEGSEGVGKSSNMAAVCDVLAGQGIDYYQTREPGGTQLAEALRQVLLADWDEAVDPLTELLIVFAARNQHIKMEILPRLRVGQWVVCDRFTDATYAYQGAARGVAGQRIATLEQWVQAELQPDLTLYLDLDPEVGRARIADREKDRLESENAEFFAAVRRGYLDRAGGDARFRIVDASRDLALVQRDVADHVREFVKEAGHGD